MLFLDHREIHGTLNDPSWKLETKNRNVMAEILRVAPSQFLEAGFDDLLNN